MTKSGHQKDSFMMMHLFQAICLLSFLLRCNAFCATNTTPSSQARKMLNLSTTLKQSNYDSSESTNSALNRRSFVNKIIIGTTAGALSTSFPAVLVQAAEEGKEDSSSTFPSTFKRSNPKSGFGYEFIPPPSVIKTANKPVQTHLDEINLPTEVKGYTYGITVDPIRIKSLRDFGTPNEVAAKIVMAELRRDGVLDVTLARDAREDVDRGAYDVEYISDGKRGEKHFATRTIVQDGKLYVLTIQVKQADWKTYEGEVIDALQSFRVLDKDAF